VNDLGSPEAFLRALCRFPALHVDTGKKFPREMYALPRSNTRGMEPGFLIELCPPIEAVDSQRCAAARSAARRPKG